jgi:hypothetical protein
MSIDKDKSKVFCNVCGKSMPRHNLSSTIVCSDCAGDKQKAANRIFTKDTVFLVCKWYEEGDSIKKICQLLNRSEMNVTKALKIGGKVM